MVHNKAIETELHYFQEIRAQVKEDGPGWRKHVPESTK